MGDSKRVDDATYLNALVEKASKDADRLWVFDNAELFAVLFHRVHHRPIAKKHE
jgi:hypothetical protein